MPATLRSTGPRLLAFHNTESKPLCYHFILNLAKLTVFASFTIFLLFLPLGDPTKKCKLCKADEPNLSCAVCNTYMFLRWFTKHSIEGLIMLKCMLFEALYEMKLSFYWVLSVIDSQDFCRMCDSKALKTAPRSCSCWIGDFCNKAKLSYKKF